MMGDPPHSSDQPPAANTGPGPLASQQEALAAFLQHSPKALAMFDHYMRLVFATQRWRELFGCDDERGSSFYALIPDYPISWLTAHQRCLNGTRQVVERDRFKRADGTELLLRWSMTPWLHDDGSVGGLIMEVDTSKGESPSHTVLSIANRMFRSLYNQIPVMLFSIDRHGLISDANTHWLEAMEYGEADIVGKPLLDVLTKSSRKYVERVCLP